MVAFGDTPSPFLSIATVQNYARENNSGYSKAADAVEDNMCVDDLLSGAPEDDGALQLKEDATFIVAKLLCFPISPNLGGFSLCLVG